MKDKKDGAKEVSKERFVGHLIAAGFTKKEAEVEYKDIIDHRK